MGGKKRLFMMCRGASGRTAETLPGPPAGRPQIIGPLLDCGISGIHNSLVKQASVPVTRPGERPSGASRRASQRRVQASVQASVQAVSETNNRDLDVLCNNDSLGLFSDLRDLNRFPLSAK